MLILWPLKYVTKATVYVNEYNAPDSMITASARETIGERNVGTLRITRPILKAIKAKKAEGCMQSIKHCIDFERSTYMCNQY